MARRGAIWGSFLKVWPVLIFLLPGIIGWALHQQQIITIPTKSGSIDGSLNIDGDQVFASMVIQLLPVGLRGLVVGGLLAALMSSLSSLFNSCATLFTVDIYEKLVSKKSEKHLVRVGRFATSIIVFFGLLWIPIMYRVADGGIYQYLQSVQGYLAPPIASVFLLGLFYKRINSVGAIAGLISGFTLGMAKLIIQVNFSSIDNSKLSSPEWLASIGDFSFLYATGALFLISSIIIILFSFMTKAQSDKSIHGLTYGSIDKDEISGSVEPIDRYLTAITLILVLGLYIYFSFWLS
jgi:SSS family solute:Na+ symporter